MHWLRLHHDTPTDPKWRLVAVESGYPVHAVLAVWVSMMVNASQAEPRGVLQDWNDRVVGASLDLKGEAVAAIRQAMQGVVLDGDVLTGWDKRQRAGDSSTERVRQYRERLAAGTGRKDAPYDAKAIIARDGGACVYCLSTEKVCVDHMVPVILGGDHKADNLACACKRCNSGKSGRTPEQAGYGIASAEALARYRAVLLRLGIDPVTAKKPPSGEARAPEQVETVETVTSTDETVTGAAVTVTSGQETVPPLARKTPESKKESNAGALGAERPPGRVISHPATAQGELFGQVLADMTIAVPEVSARQIRAQFGKAMAHLGPDAALAIARQALQRMEPWSWFCKALDERSKAPGVQPAKREDPAIARLRARIAEERGTL
jgi:HNH endonuclease